MDRCAQHFPYEFIYHVDIFIYAVVLNIVKFMTNLFCIDAAVLFPVPTILYY